MTDSPHVHNADHSPTRDHAAARHSRAASSARVASVLGWPAWQRVLVVLPVLLLLWLAVAWASAEVVPW